MVAGCPPPADGVVRKAQGYVPITPPPAHMIQFPKRADAQITKRINHERNDV
jgi:hypothetical protein